MPLSELLLSFGTTGTKNQCNHWSLYSAHFQPWRAQVLSLGNQKLPMNTVILVSSKLSNLPQNLKYVQDFTIRECRLHDQTTEHEILNSTHLQHLKILIRTIIGFWKTNNTTRCFPFQPSLPPHPFPPSISFIFALSKPVLRKMMAYLHPFSGLWLQFQSWKIFLPSGKQISESCAEIHANPERNASIIRGFDAPTTIGV